MIRLFCLRSREGIVQVGREGLCCHGRAEVDVGNGLKGVRDDVSQKRF